MFEITNIKLKTLDLVSHESLKTAQDNYQHLKRLFIKITTKKHVVFTECPAFENKTYLANTRLDVVNYLSDYLIPKILKESKQKTFQYLQVLEKENVHLLAKASLEMGLHALYALNLKKTLHHYFSFKKRPIYAMPVLGIELSKKALQKKLNQFTEQGYRYLKCKIIPGNYLTMLDELLQDYSHLKICLDANESFSFKQAKTQFLNLKGNYRYIEQPLNRNNLSECAQLHRLLPINICLDESINNLNDIVFMHQHQIANRVTIKMAKLGGFQSAIDCINYCQQHDIKCHIGGLFESNLGRSYNLVLAMHHGLEDVAEICPASAYFKLPDIKILASFTKGTWLLDESVHRFYQLDKNDAFFQT